MLIFGCCLYSILAMLFNFLKEVKLLVAPVNELAGLTFIAFLLHHQIIYFLFAKLNYSQMSAIEAIYFFSSICILSLGSAYIIKPYIAKLENSFRKMLLR